MVNIRPLYDKAEAFGLSFEERLMKHKILFVFEKLLSKTDVIVNLDNELSYREASKTVRKFRKDKEVGALLTKHQMELRVEENKNVFTADADVYLLPKETDVLITRAVARKKFFLKLVLLFEGIIVLSGMLVSHVLNWVNATIGAYFVLLSLVATASFVYWKTEPPKGKSWVNADGFWWHEQVLADAVNWEELDEQQN